MGDDRNDTDAPKTGDAQGGADAGGAGNILGGVQPDTEGEGKERRDD